MVFVCATPANRHADGQMDNRFDKNFYLQNFPDGKKTITFSAGPALLSTEKATALGQ